MKVRQVYTLIVAIVSFGMGMEAAGASLDKMLVSIGVFGPATAAAICLMNLCDPKYGR